MIKNLVVILCLSFLLLTNTAFAQCNDNKTAAIAAAKSWLGTVDAGKYGESWSQAASYFKARVSKNQWVQMVGAVRKPLGKVVSRNTIGATCTKSLPGAPDGQYVVIQFKTSFANKKSAIETITPMLDKDNKWRVSGYFIK